MYFKLNHVIARPNRGEYVVFTSLAPGRFENNFQNVFFKLISWIETLSNSCETVLRRMPQNPSDDMPTLVQVMAWCRQATSYYLSQCCPRSLSPYGVTRPQWVNKFKVSRCYNGVTAVCTKPWCCIDGLELDCSVQCVNNGVTAVLR